MKKTKVPNPMIGLDMMRRYSKTKSIQIYQKQLQQYLHLQQPSKSQQRFGMILPMLHVLSCVLKSQKYIKKLSQCSSICITSTTKKNMHHFHFHFHFHNIPKFHLTAFGLLFNSLFFTPHALKAQQHRIEQSTHKHTSVSELRRNTYTIITEFTALRIQRDIR